MKLKRIWLITSGGEIKALNKSISIYTIFREVISDFMGILFCFKKMINMPRTWKTKKLDIIRLEINETYGSNFGRQSISTNFGSGEEKNRILTKKGKKKKQESPRLKRNKKSSMLAVDIRRPNSFWWRAGMIKQDKLYRRYGKMQMIVI